jgi:hypothetical protein
MPRLVIGKQHFTAVYRNLTPPAVLHLAMPSRVRIDFESRGYDTVYHRRRRPETLKPPPFDAIDSLDIYIGTGGDIRAEDDFDALWLQRTPMLTGDIQRTDGQDSFTALLATASDNHFGALMGFTYPVPEAQVSAMCRDAGVPVAFIGDLDRSGYVEIMMLYDDGAAWSKRRNRPRGYP